MRGFGCSGNRFKPIPSSQPLGPGHYNVSSQAPCLIAKLGGTGSFASKSNRFKRIYGRSSPGPAAYNTESNHTSPTVKLVKPPQNQKIVTASIGPGHYNPKLPISNALSWFKTTSKRFTEAVHSEGPGPGDYVLPSTLSACQVPRIAQPVVIRDPVVDLGVSLLPLPLKYAQEMQLIENYAPPGPGTYEPKILRSKYFSVKVSAGFALPESVARH
jgi:Sperm-tail PG-rich repeat